MRWVQVVLLPRRPRCSLLLQHGAQCGGHHGGGHGRSEGSQRVLGVFTRDVNALEVFLTWGRPERRTGEWWQVVFVPSFTPVTSHLNTYLISSSLPCCLQSGALLQWYDKFNMLWFICVWERKKGGVFSCTAVLVLGFYSKNWKLTAGGSVTGWKQGESRFKLRCEVASCCFLFYFGVLSVSVLYFRPALHLCLVHLTFPRVPDLFASCCGFVCLFVRPVSLLFHFTLLPLDENRKHIFCTWAVNFKSPGSPVFVLSELCGTFCFPHHEMMKSSWTDRHKLVLSFKQSVVHMFVLTALRCSCQVESKTSSSGESVGGWGGGFSTGWLHENRTLIPH